MFSTKFQINKQEDWRLTHSIDMLSINKLSPKTCFKEEKSDKFFGGREFSFQAFFNKVNSLQINLINFVFS